METLTIIFAICCIITVQASFLKWLFTPTKKNEVPEMRNPPKPPKKEKDNIIIDVKVNVAKDIIHSKDKKIIERLNLEIECSRLEIDYLKKINEEFINIIDKHYRNE